MRIHHAALLAVTFATGFFTAPPALAQTTWFQENVRSLAGAELSLTLDDAEVPHATFVSVQGDTLFYGVRTGGTWSIEVVSSTGRFHENSLALDTAGNPHVVCQVATPSYDLWYATKTGGVWNIEIIDTGTAANCALYLDGAGVPHVAYRKTNGLYYAERIGGVWTIEVVDNTRMVGAGLDLVLGAGGTPHISYFDYIVHNIYHAARVGGSWVTTLVDTVGVNTAIAIGGGVVHIAYADAFSGGSLYHAGNDGSGWMIEKVDGPPGGPVQASIDIALHSDGKPRIAYHTHLPSGLRYARKVGSLWGIAEVDTLDRVNVSLALDSLDGPHLMDADGSNLTVQYYWSDMPTGVGEGVLRGPALLAAPNPAQGGRTEIRFAHKAEFGGARFLHIYDISGRLVRDLFLDSSGRASWDGRTGEGRSAPAGVYFFRSSGAEVTGRVILVR